jgi:hypothetical protein
LFFAQRKHPTRAQRKAAAREAAFGSWTDSSEYRDEQRQFGFSAL